MSRRTRIQSGKRVLGLGLAVFGGLLWAAAAVLPDAALGGHMEARSLAIIVGGASVAGGIALLATAA